MRYRSLGKVLSAVLLASGILWGAVKTANAGSKMVSYKHKTEGFSLSVPGNWEIREDMKYELFNIPMLALRPLEGENDDFRENINVVDEKISPSLGVEGYLKANLKNLPSQLKSYELVKTGDLKARSNAKYMIYTHRLDGITGKLKVISFLFTRKEKAFVLTCTANEKSFDHYLGLFMKIGMSFKPA
jgi:hypothetical protein